MIKLKGNKVIIELSKKEINKLMNEGVLFEPRKDEFKFLDNSKNIFIELKGGLKEK